MNQTLESEQLKEVLSGRQSPPPSEGYYASYWTHQAGAMVDQIDQALDQLRAKDRDVVISLRGEFHNPGDGQAQIREAIYALDNIGQIRYWVNMANMLDELRRPSYYSTDTGIGRYKRIDDSIIHLLDTLLTQRQEGDQK